MLNKEMAKRLREFFITVTRFNINKKYSTKNQTHKTGIMEMTNNKAIVQLKTRRTVSCCKYSSSLAPSHTHKPTLGKLMALNIMQVSTTKVSDASVGM